VLGAAGRLGRERQPLVLRQRVDRGRLAGVAAADEGDFRQLRKRQLVERLAVVRKRALRAQAWAVFAVEALSRGGVHAAL
jgi:hypothetical protein